MKFAHLPPLTALVLLACQPAEAPAESTADAPAALGSPSPPYIPAVVIPAGQIAEHMHLGMVIGYDPVSYYAFDASTVHLLAGADVPASITDFWAFKFGFLTGDGYFEVLAEATTQPHPVGLGDLHARRWYAVPNSAAGAVGWTNVLAVLATPHGSPPAPSFVFALPDASITP